ncbi:hypothetical protein AAFF_G00016800 [Aldrovandia affinis]|uniref:Uncharacterized protein n=1 Tax=Aldrovandia affinis TaxID=143900 RepID=A0AAD7WHU7_9TELE|nr:hypothetical protein AAFF_G00016800 [Aldrovandia affinis]
MKSRPRFSQEKRLQGGTTCGFFAEGPVASMCVTGVAERSSKPQSCQVTPLASSKAHLSNTRAFAAIKESI